MKKLRIRKIKEFAKVTISVSYTTEIQSYDKDELAKVSAPLGFSLTKKNQYTKKASPK